MPDDRRQLRWYGACGPLVCAVVLLAMPAYAGPFGWINFSGWQFPRIPTVTRTATPAATATPTAASTPTRELGVDDLEYHRTPAPAGIVRVAPPGTRIVLTDLLATAGGWGVLWIEVSGDLWDPRTPTEVWYAHTGTPQVPALRIASVHRIDRLPVYLASVSPDGSALAVVLNELVNWRTAKRADPTRVTHQWFGRLNLDGTWALAPNPAKPITTNLGVHGGIGHAVWTDDVVRVATEATCVKAAHQCLYTQRLKAATGTVLNRWSVTKPYMGHQTAPQVIGLDDKTSRLVTVSDAAGKYGGLMAYGDVSGGWPLPLSFPFVLDYDPRARWNGDAGMGRRIGVLWRQVRTNDDKLNAANEGWKLRFITWDLVRVGSAAPKVVVLSDTQLTDWSTRPAYSYGYPTNSRWTTGLEHIPGGGWAVGFQDDGWYTVGAISETGEWRWRERVAEVVDYAGDVAVSRDGQRIGYAVTAQMPEGLSLIVGER